MPAPSLTARRPSPSNIAGGRWTQAPQRYHARSLRALREKYAALTDRAGRDPVLEATGCLPWLG